MNYGSKGLFTLFLALAWFMQNAVTLANPVCTPPPAGLVSWWRGEGDGSDALGNNNGTLQGGAGFVPGEAGLAFAFNGSSQFLDVADSPSLNPSNSISLEAWIYPHSSQGAFPPLIKKTGTGPNVQTGYALELTGTNIIFSLYLNGPTLFLQTPAAPITFNQWTHVAAVYDGSTASVYINGVLATAVPASGKIIPATTDLQLGHDAVNTSRYYNGLIDEASIYNAALSAAQVQAIYNAGSAGKCFTPTLPSITRQPQSRTVPVGASASFLVAASGTPPLAYQWQFNGTNLPGATNPVLTLSNVQLANSGNYAAMVTNSVGGASSSNALLKVVAPQCYPAPAGLAGWWRGEGNGYDAAGPNNGTLQGGPPPYFAPGEVGQAFSFDGATEYLDVPDNASLNPSTNISLETWIYPLSSQGPFPPIIKKTGNASTVQSGYSLELAGTNGVVFVLYLNGPTLFLETPVVPVALNQWSHVAAVYDGSTASVYVNGILATSIPASGLIIPASTDLQLGHDAVNTSRYFNGLIDEASVYGTALSTSQIQALYFAGTAGKCFNTSAPAITQQPQDQTVTVGTTAVFSVGASGTQPLNYQWTLNGTNITGATNSLFALASAKVTDAGTYAVSITNPYGSITSSNANLTVNAVPCAAPLASLVSWWRGEGDAIDVAGTNNGSLQGGASFASGEVGQAFSFNGTASFVDVPDSAALELTSQITIEAWINTRSTNADRSIVAKVGGAGGNNGYQFVLSHNALVGQFNSPGRGWPSAQVSIPVPIVPGQWCHVAWTYDQSSLKLYFNGQLVTSKSIGAAAINTSSSSLRIGDDDNNGTIFDGLIDEPSVYNTALSAAQIQAIYNAGSAGKCFVPVAPAITRQPQSQTVTAGTSVSFSVVATGTQPLSYQWLLNGTNIPGATSTLLALATAQATNAGAYSVMVTSPYGSVTSSNAVLTVSVPSCIPPLGGMVSWWRGEGNAFDAAGGNNGSLQGGVSYVSGEAGQGFSFDGSSGSVVIPDSASLRLTNQLTIEAWINTRSTNADRSIVAKVGGGGGNNGYQFVLSHNALVGEFNSPGRGWPSAQVSIPVPIIPGQWCHVAWTYDQSSLKLYFDGQLVASSSIGAVAINTSSSNLRIGDDDNNGTLFDGLIDEPAVYNTALSAAQIQAIYNASSAGKCFTPVAPAITKQPQSQTVTAGGNVSFSFTVTGTQPLSYQWTLNGTNIAGATNTSLSLVSAQATNAGAYAAIVSGPYGSVTTSNAVLTVIVPSCVAPPPGLVSWWRAENNGIDSIGNNNGTLQGGAGFVQGEVGQAFSFNGSSQFLDVPDSPSLNPAGNLSLEAWIYANSSQSQFPPLIKKTGNASTVQAGYSLEMAGASGVVFVLYLNGPTLLIETPVVSVPLNQWSHVAAVYNGTSAAVYVNGVLSAAVQASGQIIPATTDLQLGHDAVNTGRFFNGLIDEASVYNTALSATQIQAIYGAASAGKCFTPAPPSITGQPQSQTVPLGGQAIFSASSTGTGPLGYQWEFNGTNLPGATNSQIVITNVQFANAGSYWLVVSNAVGVAASSNALLTVIAPQCVPSAAGLVSWWRGESSEFDAIGTNNGSLQGGASFLTGEVGQAFAFDGTSGSVVIPDSASLRLTNQLTIEAWINTRSTNADRSIVAKLGGGIIGNAGYQFALSRNSLLGQFNSPGRGWPSAKVSVPIPIIPGTWCHVAWTYDQSYLRLYFNGQLVASNLVGPAVISTTADSLRIGDDDNNSTFFDGFIDEASVYNTALSDAQIQAIYNSGSAGKCFNPLAPAITQQPQSQTVTAGTGVSFSIIASGTQPLNYQWALNGTNIPGATNSFLSLATAKGSDAGVYNATVTGPYGSATSSNAVLVVNVPSCVTPPAGLVSWWRAENNGYDAAGANNGSLQGGAGFVPGEVGQAFSFNGSSQFLDVPDSPSLNPTSSISLEAWIYPNSSQSSFPPLIKKTGNASTVQAGYSLEMAGTSGVVFVLYLNGPTLLIETPVVPVALSQWNHVAAVYNGTSAAVYVNGVLSAAVPASGQIIPATTDLQLGHDAVNTGRFFNGLIDEASVYNTALTGAQIQAIYGAGSSGKCFTPVNPSITQQPQDQTVTAGTAATLSVTASGTQPLSYQWMFNGSNIPGATNASLTFSAAQIANAGTYAVAVSDPYGSVTSSNAVLTVNVPSCAAAPAGLVSWWRAEGDGFDSFGTNHGMLQGGAACSSGEVGLAFDFNGSSQYLDIPDSPGLNPASSFSLEAWVYPRSVQGQFPPLIKKTGNSSTVQSGYSLELNGNTVSFLLYLNGPTLFVQTPAVPINFNQWTHITAVYDGVHASLYLNGSVAAVIPASGQIITATTDLQLGHDAVNTSRYFNGLIDEASLYNTALSAAQIQAIYNAHAAGKCFTPAAPAITQQPIDQAVPAGGSASFSVSVTGTSPLRYQWIQNGTNVAGATNSALNLPNVQLSDAGTYSVIVTNPAGSVVSSNANLTVTPDVCDPPPSGLVSWWRAEGDANDSFGTHNGTLQGGAGFAAGEDGQAFDFSNGTGFVLVPDDPSWNFGSSDFSIELWARFLSGGGTQALVGHDMGQGTVNKWIFWLNGGQLQMHLYSVGSGAVYLGSGNFSPAPNQWYHLAVTRSGSLLTFYVNGAVNSQVTNSIAVPTASASLTIGQSEGSFDLAGYEDEVTIYNRSLSGSEIGAIYNAHAAGKCFTAIAPVITKQPTNQIVSAGTTVTFSVAATGTAPLTYQWSLNGTSLPGATNSSLGISNAQPVNDGTYVVAITNIAGSVTSSNALLTVLNAACFAEPSGLVGWWRGEGDASDNIGTNNGILQAGVSFAPGEVGQAFNFGVPAANVRIPSSPTLNVGAGAGLSIEGWVKPGDVNNDHPIVEYNSGNYGVTLWQAGSTVGHGALEADIRGADLGDHMIRSGAGVLSTNSLEHVAVTYDNASGNASLYVNGAIVAQTKLGAITPSTTGDLYFGYRPFDTGAGQYFVGRMDEISLYNRALSGAEVTGIYLAGNKGKCFTPVPPAITLQPTNQLAVPGCTVTYAVAATGTSPLRYQWKRNGVAIAKQTNTVLILNSITFSNFGSYSVTVTNTGGSVTSSNATLAQDNLPIPGAFVAQRSATGGVRVNVADVLSSASDADLDPLSIVGVNSNSSAGGNVNLSGSWIYYLPPPGFTNADSFNYALSDGHCGGTAQGTVTVRVTVDTSPSSNVSIQPLGNGSIQLTFDGIPGYVYRIQATVSLLNPTWQDLATVTADQYGVYQYIDTPPTNSPARYYRSVWP